MEFSSLPLTSTMTNTTLQIRQGCFQWSGADFSIVLAVWVWGEGSKAQYQTQVINSVLFIVHVQNYTPAEFTEEFVKECKREVFVSRKTQNSGEALRF